MRQVLASSWALLLGIMLLMVGNGLQGTLIGVRGGIEGFSTFELSLVVSAYFLGFLGGARLTPTLIGRVGHVRVFAALGSFISAALILYPALASPLAWIGLRFVIGFCFCGVYVTAESWLNNAATNETRGQALSAYMIVQMVGIVAGQALLTMGDPAGWILFVIPSVLVSLSFAPILLSVQPTPAFGTTRPMSLRGVYRSSPLGVVGMVLLGGIFAGQFGMSAVYGGAAGLSVTEISVFVSAIFVGALVLQYPIGWMSDRMDRRVLIFAAAIVAALAGGVGVLFGHHYPVLLGVAFLMGGLSNPLYSLLIAYTNDYLAPEDMAAASGGLLFANGLGAIGGPLVSGWALEALGPPGFWAYMGMLMALLALYAAWRMTRRPSAYSAGESYDAVSYAPILPTSTPVALEAAQEFYADAAEDPARDLARDAARDSARDLPDDAAGDFPGADGTARGGAARGVKG
jgi:MFS family permease